MILTGTGFKSSAGIPSMPEAFLFGNFLIAHATSSSITLGSLSILVIPLPSWCFVWLAYSSSVYSLHLYLIFWGLHSSFPSRSLIVPFRAEKLDRITFIPANMALIWPFLLASSRCWQYSFSCRSLSFLASRWNCALSFLTSSLFPLAFAILRWSATLMVLSDNHLSVFFGFWYGTCFSAILMVVSRISRHSSSGSFPSELSESKLFFTSTAYHGDMLSTLNLFWMVLFLILHNLSFTLATNSWWSDPQSAPGSVFVEAMELFQRCWHKIKSIWFRYWPFGEVHVYKRRLGWMYLVFAILKRFSWQNCTRRSPASFLTPNPNLPTVLASSLSPTFALKSPMMYRRSFFDIWFSALWISL